MPDARAGARPRPAGDDAEQPIDLLAYVRRLGRHLVPAALLGVITALVVALALGLSGSSSTQYHTKAHVMLQPNATNATVAAAEGQLLGNYMRTYVALGDADVITNDVVKALNGKYTAEQISTMMNVYWGGGSLLLAVQAVAPDHQDALDISEAGAKALVAHQLDLVNMSRAQAPHLALVQDAIDDTPATSGGSSNHFKGIVPGIGAGVLVTLLAAVVLEWLNSRRRHRATPGTTR